MIIDNPNRGISDISSHLEMNLHFRPLSSRTLNLNGIMIYPWDEVFKVSGKA
jgi:hypothetical protein